MAPFWGETQLVQTQKKKAKKENFMIWRTKMQPRVQLKDSICFKWVQISSYKFGPWTPSKVGLWATLDEGPRSNEIEQSYWMIVISWTHDI
jgi:hypothetical protein